MRKVKFILLTVLTSIILFSAESFCQTDNELENTICSILTAYSEKDTATLNSFINEETGLYVLFRRGVFDEIEKTMQIDFDKPVPEYFPYFEFEKFGKIQYEALPQFDLDSETWNKFGLFVDTTYVDNLLSKTAKNLVEYRGDNIEASLIRQFEEIESKSFRIILVDQNGGEFIFYLTKLNDKWVLTIIDRVSSDTSA